MPLRFTLRQLEYLVAVTETGSVTVAGERCGVSAPSVSAAIAQLEAELGVPLFIRRHAQGMVVTPQGREMTEQARRAIAAARGMVDLAATLSGTVLGALNIGCLATFAPVVLPMLRRRFADAHPQVDVAQTEADQATLIEGLRAARLDVALTYDLAVPTDLVFTAFGDLPPFAMFGADHALADRTEVTIPELAAHPMVMLDLPLSVDYFTALFTDAGARPHIAERSRDLALVQAMVANGFGYGIANLRPQRADAPDGRPLRLVPLGGRVRPVRLGLLSPPGGERLPAIRAFAAMCAQVLPDLIARSLAVTRPAS
jgi:DNA-binding transcriptional LysR family regulator